MPQSYFGLNPLQHSGPISEGESREAIDPHLAAVKPGSVKCGMLEVT